MSDFFGYDSPTKKKREELDTLLYEAGTGEDLYIILESDVEDSELRKIVRFVTDSGVQNFKILNALKFEVQDDENSKNVVKFYNQNSSDLSKYIKEWSKVVTVGRAIYNITKSDDLDVAGFQDTILWNTSFFDPTLKCQIFPISHQYLWLSKDSFDVWFTRKQIKVALDFIVKKRRIVKPELVEVQNPEAFLESYYDYKGLVAFDLETRTLDPWSYEGFIICMTLCFDENPLKGYYLDIRNVDPKVLNRFFKGKKLVGNNLKYDLRWMVKKANVDRDNLQIYSDNMMTSHVINEMQYSSLKSDAWIYTDYGGYDKALSDYQDLYPASKKDYSLIPKSTLFEYATMDAIVSMLSYFKHKEVIEELDKKYKLENGWSLRRYLDEIVMPAVNAFVDIELEGFVIDWDKWDTLSYDLWKQIQEKRAYIYEFMKIPKNVDIDSDTQLGRYLQKLGWPAFEVTATGVYSVGENSMLYWAKKGYKEYTDLLLEYTEYSTMAISFVGQPSIEDLKLKAKSDSRFQEMLDFRYNQKKVKEEATGGYAYKRTDGKIHSNYTPLGSESGRGRSSNPNVQNYPKRGYWAKRLRECFIAPEGYVLSENDAAGLQLRAIASLSQDPTMVEAFTGEGSDLHSKTAQAIFLPSMPIKEFLEKKKTDKKVKACRQNGKTANLSLAFSSSAFSFANDSLLNEWSLQNCKDYIKENSLQKSQESLYQNLMQDEESLQSREDRYNFSMYWACAVDIRKKFFTTYSHLETWHEEVKANAKKNGYVRSDWGPFRRIPRLLYVGRDDKAKEKNLYNIAINSPLQSWEACYVLGNIPKLMKLMKENKLKSKIFNNIHDSVMLYIHKDEMQIMKELMIKVYHTDFELAYGIPYILEYSYVNLDNGDVWGIQETDF